MSAKSVFQVFMPIFIGVLLLNYPAVTTTYSDVANSTKYFAADGFSSSYVKDEVSAAATYNDKHISHPVTDPWLNLIRNESNKDFTQYNRILNLNGDGVIGRLQINKVGMNLSIYHDSTKEVLDKGVGHIYGSGFPVGNSASILVGHSGLANLTVFDRIGELENGDVITINYGGNTYKNWKVYRKDVVLPEQIQNIYNQMSKDEIILVTCTPFGINTHRLLVRGKLTDKQLYNNNISSNINYWNVIPLWCYAIYAFDLLLVAIVVIRFVVKQFSKNKRENEKKNFK